MEFKTYLMYVGVMALVTYLVRAVPFAAMNRKITSPFFKSFLAYIPYAVLSAMTVPAIFTATGSVIASTFAFDPCLSQEGFDRGSDLCLRGGICDAGIA